MKVRIDQTIKVKLGPLSSRTYPPGTYEITDPKVLEQLDGQATVAPPATAGDLSADQVAALAAVADGVLTEAAAQARAALFEADLDSMKVAELRLLAQACAVEVDASARKADLVAALTSAREALKAAG